MGPIPSYCVSWGEKSPRRASLSANDAALIARAFSLFVVSRLCRSFRQRLMKPGFTYSFAKRYYYVQQGYGNCFVIYISVLGKKGGFWAAKYSTR